MIWLGGWIFIQDGSSFIAFAVLNGFVYSAPFSLYTPFLGDIFGRSAVGTLMGIITLGHALFGGIGPYLWGKIADTTGSYALNCPVSRRLLCDRDDFSLSDQNGIYEITNHSF